MVEFRIGELENGGQFPPGHLRSTKRGPSPSSCTADRGGEPSAVRLEDAGADAIQPLTAASSSSSLKISMNDAVTIPSRSTTKTQGSLSSPHSLVEAAGVSWAGSPVRTGWS